MTARVATVAGLTLITTACASPSSLERANAELPESKDASADPAQPQAASNSPADADAKAVPVVSRNNDPRVSTSPGVEGGVVVLWPRMIPASITDGSASIAATIQDHTKALAERTLPGRPIDVRPAPERTCRKAGCLGVAIGAMLTRKGDGCAVVAFVMPPGTNEPTTLVRWAGDLKLKSSTIPFRDHPESQATIKDYARCKDLKKSLSEADPAVEAALRSAASG